MNWKDKIEKELLATKDHPIKHMSVSKEEIQYEGVQLHKKISQLKSEEIVRASLIHKLVKKLDYDPKYIELEKGYENKVMGRHKKSKDDQGFIDLILKDPDGNPYLFIEIKEPNEYENGKKEIEGQLFNLAEEEQKKYETSAQESEPLEASIPS